MRLLDRYIFRQILAAALLAVGLFVFVLVVGNAIREVIEQLASGRVDWATFFKLLALLIPGVIPYALPLGLLTGILLVLGRMSSQHEIMAMKAAGQSIYQIARPIFLIALLGAIFSFFINFYYAPAADFAYKTTLTNIVRNNPLQFIQPRTFIREFPGYVIYASSREGSELRDFRIWELDKNGRVSIALRAQSGSLAFDNAQQAIVLTLNEGTGEKRKDEDPEDLQDPSLPTLRFESLAIRLPLDQILGKKNLNQKLSLMTFGELVKARENWLPEGTPPTPENKFRARIRVQFQIQKTLSGAFAIFSLTAIAVPLGIKTGRAETFVNLAMALGLALAYYLLVNLIGILEKQPHLRPDLLVWVPNILFIALGVYLLRRANRH